MRYKDLIRHKAKIKESVFLTIAHSFTSMAITKDWFRKAFGGRLAVLFIGYQLAIASLSVSSFTQEGHRDQKTFSSETMSKF